MKTRNDRLFLYDIVECCEKMEQYISGKTEEYLHHTPILQDALVRNIEIIGEASKNLTEELRLNNPQITWREIIRMRDKVSHHYFRLDLDIIWQTVTQDIPTLKPEVEKILQRISD